MDLQYHQMNNCILKYTIKKTNDDQYICIDGFMSKHECRDLVIPAEINGLPVKEIGHSAFYNEKIKSIVFPDSLCFIKDRAFLGCNRIKSLVFPKNLIKIGFEAFYECYNLEKITFNEGLRIIDAYAFSNSKIKKVKFPDSLEEICNNAFESCELSEVVFGSNIDIIHDYAFAYNRKIKNINLPEGLISIGTSAFEGSGLVSIILPDSLAYLNFDAFNGSANLEELHIGASLENDDYGRTIAFACPKLKTITVSEKNENFGIVNDCLYDMRTNELIRTPSNIKSVIIPKWVEAITPDCFYEVSPDIIIIKPESLDYLQDSFIENANVIRCVPNSKVEKYLLDYGYTNIYPIQSSISAFLEDISEEKDKT